MTAPTFTIRMATPPEGPVTAQQARKYGATFDGILWAACDAAQKNPDIVRRLRMWMADCAARVLPIYERLGSSPAPRKAILAARAFANGEISDAARIAAWDAAHEAARLAVKDPASSVSSDVWAAASSAASSAAISASKPVSSDISWPIAWAAVTAASTAAIWVTEKDWQFDRLCEWLSDEEPEPWPLDATEAA